MSFIYQYHLRNSKERREIDLLSYKEKLKMLIKDYFSNNLKEVITFNDFYEFRLYSSVSSQSLRNLGKDIKEIIPSRHGFVRRKQVLYAIIEYINTETKNISLEFIDYMAGNKEQYITRVENLFKEMDKEIASDEIKNNYYIDVYSADISADKFKIISGEEEVREGDCYFVEAFHRHVDKKFSSRREDGEDDSVKNHSLHSLIELDEMYDYNYLTLENNYENNFIADYLMINKFEKKNEDLDKIKETLSLSLKAMEEFDLDFDDMDSDKEVFFSVYDVGQALATSFNYKDNIPFLYFDYGVPFGRNSHTFPNGTNLPVERNTKIIISHLDKDHWYGLSKFVDSYKCTWYIPDQRRGVQINHKLSEIIVEGGSVEIIDSNRNHNSFYISYSGASNTRPSRIAKSRHETGLTLCVEAKDESNNNCKILIVGDQDYDYITNNTLQNINVLVACHHGGKYSWTTDSNLPSPNRCNNEIIYSYGYGNSYNHPSHMDQHQTNGWSVEHHTATDGTYTKLIRA